MIKMTVEDLRRHIQPGYRNQGCSGHSIKDSPAAVRGFTIGGNRIEKSMDNPHGRIFQPVQGYVKTAAFTHSRRNGQR